MRPEQLRHDGVPVRHDCTKPHRQHRKPVGHDGEHIGVCTRIGQCAHPLISPDAANNGGDGTMTEKRHRASRMSGALQAGRNGRTRGSDPVDVLSPWPGLTGLEGAANHRTWPPGRAHGSRSLRRGRVRGSPASSRS
jgi:hypothetical protein